jgi:chromate reductase, NAD(P)H dehydrogenase (quinone)
MKKIIAIGGSNSRSSINKRFAIYAANRIEHAVVDVIDLNDFEFPIYSIDREKLEGFPVGVDHLIAKIADSDGIALSLAEHNGTYTVAFKNVMDWMSRRKLDFFAHKPMLLLSTSPGGFGGGNVMDAALKRLPKFEANIVANFSLPKYGENFDPNKGIVSPELKSEFDQALEKMNEVLNVN